jgi:superfamily II DNA or RNA helicase
VTTTQETRTLQSFVDELGTWATDLLRQLDELDREIQADREHLSLALTGRVFDGAPTQRITQNLRMVRCGKPGDGSEVVALLSSVGARHAGRRSLLSASAEARTMATAALEQLQPSSRSMFGTRHPADLRAQGVVALGQLRDWADRTGFARALAERASNSMSASPMADGVQCLADAIGVAAPDAVEVLAGADVTTLSAAWESGRNLTTSLERLRDQVRVRFASVQEEMVDRQLASFPIEVLKELVPSGTRLQAMRDAGADTVADVIALGDLMHSVSGISAATAREIRGAAQTVRRTAKEDLGARFDADPGNRAVTALVHSLWRLQSLYDATATVGPALEALAWDLEPIGPALGAGEDVILLHRASPRRGVDVVRHLRERAGWLRATGLDTTSATHSGSGVPDDAAWEDYRRRAVLYQGLLREVLGLEDDVEALRGGLPAEIAETVERQRLDTRALSTDLQSSLRGYQAFGAKYALAQRRVLIGDEMGLGKTIQALAAMSHLHAQGASRFLVVCPPSVLVNWMREVRRHSTLRAFRLHGPEKDQAARRWRSVGGVAVTSYNTLANLDLGDEDVDLLVVDEAHLVKNPKAKRTAAVASVGERSERVLFLTGTPLENTVEDFTNLLEMLQPEVVANLDPAAMIVGAKRFREQVAPGYLRRRTADVATELPPLMRTDEWVLFSDAERDRYRNAISDGQFHTARQVAYLADPGSSSKLERLQDIVDEATSNGHHVLVFSFYLDVLRAVANRLGDRVVGTITGQTPADSRQGIADRLRDARVPSVLVSQVTAGGVGMNIQAASVVILCEPQLKPSTEEQALKRAHRMGQLNSVQVHRLVTEDSVDERMLEILEQKAELIEKFVDTSELAQAAPSATDVNETQLIRDVMSREQRRQAETIMADRTSRPNPAATAPSEDGQTVVEPSKRRTRRSSSTLRRPGPSPATRPPVRDLISVESCGSCNTPIGPMGHCRCS